jgi:hypothetical protein
MFQSLLLKFHGPAGCVRLIIRQQSRKRRGPVFATSHCSWYVLTRPAHSLELPIGIDAAIGAKLAIDGAGKGQNEWEYFADGARRRAVQRVARSGCRLAAGVRRCR